VELSITMFRCRENATVASPECEDQILRAALAQVLNSPASNPQWKAAGQEGSRLDLHSSSCFLVIECLSSGCHRRVQTVVFSASCPPRTI
jgi:hypothetical protein